MIKYRKEKKELSLKNGTGALISKHPNRLESYTQQSLKKVLEDEGYEVKPLGRGSLKGIPFENGGGFRVSYDGDKYLQYYPKKGSHHHAEYYKISSGENGVKRYRLKGKEKHE